MHDPDPVRCTVARFTVHLPRAVNETVSPDEAEAEIVKSRAP